MGRPLLWPDRKRKTYFLPCVIALFDFTFFGHSSSTKRTLRFSLDLPNLLLRLYSFRHVTSNSVVNAIYS